MRQFLAILFVCGMAILLLMAFPLKQDLSNIVIIPESITPCQCEIHEPHSMRLSIRNAGNAKLSVIGIGEYCTSRGICFKSDMQQCSISPGVTKDYNFRLVVHRNGAFNENLQVFFDDNGTFREMLVPISGECHE